MLMLRTYCYDNKPTHYGCKTISLCNLFPSAFMPMKIFARHFMGNDHWLFREGFLFWRNFDDIFAGNYLGVFRRENFKIENDILYANEDCLTWATEKYCINYQHNFHANFAAESLLAFRRNQSTPPADTCLIRLRYQFLPFTSSPSKEHLHVPREINSANGILWNMLTERQWRRSAIWSLFSVGPGTQ